MARPPERIEFADVRTVPRCFPCLVVCDHCDTVCRRVVLARRQVARCERCDAVVYRHHWLDVDQWLALSVAAAILFILANLWPVLHVGARGLQSDATLWSSVIALAQGTAAPIAVPAAMAVVIVPCLQIASLIWVLAFARLGRRAPGFDGAMRLLLLLRPWGMVEVCLLGILVALIKLSAYFKVQVGPGLWATAGLTILLALIASRDIAWLWRHVEPLIDDGLACAPRACPKESAMQRLGGR